MKNTILFGMLSLFIISSVLISANIIKDDFETYEDVSLELRRQGLNLQI